MTLEVMKELFGITHIGEEEVPNVKRMRIGGEEVSLSQPVTAAVPPEEEEVPVPLGPAVVVLSDEEDIPVSLQAPLSWSHQRKKSCRAPLSLSYWRKRRFQSHRPPYRSPTERKGMPCRRH
jgi:hypothetical protein